MRYTIIGDARKILPELAKKETKFDVCVTSPPYYKQRDYGHPDQLGNEQTVEEYIHSLTKIFSHLRNCMKHNGVLWLNLGDKYINGQLQGIPWRTALSLQDSGWILKSAVIWKKPNAKPDGSPNRPARSHEYIFMLAKSNKYYWNTDAVREKPAGYIRKGGTAEYSANGMNNDGQSSKTLHQMATNGRVLRDVWTIPTKRARFNTHYAAFPDELVEICLKASCPRNGFVIDIFGGTGTTGIVAKRLGMNFLQIELNKKYALKAEKMIVQDSPLHEMSGENDQPVYADTIYPEYVEGG